MTRIIAGSARGRRLAAPRGDSTRPTSDKVRGAVFNVLGQCVEADRAAAELIALNAAALVLDARLDVRRGRVEDVVPRLPRRAFALVFVDPPYAEGPEAALALAEGCLAPGGRAVAEHDARRPPPERIGGLALADRRHYGGTGISIYVGE